MALPKRFLIFRRDTDPGYSMKLAVVVTAEQNTKLGLANLDCFYQH